ncbi:MAG TPA: T9SS type A sorting domain-containing protein [Chitinophagales bacterium]|nr:T9SS type A sorting domain-containing protein [Chitinophagales bacterium]
MKTSLIVLSLFFAAEALTAQTRNPDLKRTWHWYFGHFAGLDFSNGAPVADENGAMSVLEGCAVISDTAGNLLFYTDAHQVWNRNHQIMQNGDSLGLYYPTPRDGAIIIPRPGSDSIYYIFNVDGWENQFRRGLRWHEVDMSLDNGLGAVTSKNNILYAPVTEQLAATRHCNGTDYWVVTHERSSDKFLAFRVTAAGVDSVPVVSSAGQDYGVTQQYYNLNGGYHLVFSPDGGKVAATIYWSYIITGIPEQLQLLSFNSNNGIFYDAFDLPIDTTLSIGFFSPDGLKFYIESCYARPCRFYQYDLSSGVDTIIQQSRLVVLSTDVAISTEGQIGPDGKNYLSGEWDYLTSTPNPPFLSVVENPNVAGPGCNIQYGAQLLGRGLARQGLPRFVSNFLVDTLFAPCQYNIIYSPENVQQDKILVYPNPADERIVISSQFNKEGGKDTTAGSVSVRLMDVTGRIWLVEKDLDLDKRGMDLDVSKIPNGLYLLELQRENSRKAFRIFIVHP